MNKRFKELLKKVKELVSCKASTEGGCLLRRFPFINKRPFLGGFFTGGIFTLLMEIILVLILK